MIIIRAQVNLREIATLGVINTSHRTKTKGNLYKIIYPKWAKERYNHLKIYHHYDAPWTVLIEKVLRAINKFDKGQEEKVAEKIYNYDVQSIKKPKAIQIKETVAIFEKMVKHIGK